MRSVRSICLAAVCCGFVSACVAQDQPNSLQDYAFFVCLSAAYSDATEEYRAAGERLSAETWWFVENTDAGPDDYDRIYTASQAAGQELPVDNAGVGCLRWRDSPELQSLIN